MAATRHRLNPNPGPCSRMKTILVADDNSANRELIAEILQSKGYHVIEARDGQQALEEVAKATPDLVLLDIHMPNLNGYEALARLRADERYRELPIVALTASAMRGDEDEALGSGFTAFIAKPYEIPDVLKKVRELIG